MIARIERAPQLYARVAGILYLSIILLGLFGEVYVRGTLVVAGDAATTVDNIAHSQLLWRAGIVGDLLMHVLDVPVIWMLYLLLLPVNKPLAQLATLFNIVQTAVLVANKMTLLVPLFLLGNGTYLNVLSAQHLQAFSHLAISAHDYGFGIGLIFFGFACLVRGYLIFRSGYFPKALGLMLLIAGLCYLINSFALLLAPSFAALIFPGILMPAFVGELSLSLWLVFNGVNVKLWQERVVAQVTHASSS